LAGGLSHGSSPCFHERIKGMKIGIESAAYLHGDVAFADGARRMRSHGYDCLDYGGFCNTETPLFAGSEAEFEKTLAEQKRILDAEGIEVSQTHGPWRFPMRDETEEDRAERLITVLLMILEGLLKVVLM